MGMYRGTSPRLWLCGNPEATQGSMRGANGTAFSPPLPKILSMGLSLYIVSISSSLKHFLPGKKGDFLRIRKQTIYKFQEVPEITRIHKTPVQGYRSSYDGLGRGS